MGNFPMNDNDTKRSRKSKANIDNEIENKNQKLIATPK